MNYVVIDLETTGLDYQKEQVIEVALIKYDTIFQEIGTFHTVIQLRDGNRLSDFIKNLTGLDEDILAKGMEEGYAMAIVDDFIDDDSVVVAQFAPFDLAFLSKYMIHPKWYICTKSLTTQAEPYESSSLRPTLKRLGIYIQDTHTAMGDARATTELLKIRLTQKLPHLLNYSMESSDRKLNFIPKNTITILQKEDFQ